MRVTIELRHLLLATLILLVPQFVAGSENDREVADDEFPELGEIRKIIDATDPPDGVVFLVMDYDVEAYYWVLPRLERYVKMVREKWTDAPLAVISHGDEIISLLARNEEKYAPFHRRIRQLVENYRVDFQVCGAYAALSGVDESEFAGFVDVVPSAPSQITDYRQMDYRIISLEPVW